MDEQENTADAELNLATEADEVADTEATDTNDQETESADEQEQDTLDLEDSSVDTQGKGKAELAKEKLVDDWAKKVKGDVKSLDDIPKDQAWLRPLVEAKLGVKVSEDDLIDRKLNEREDAKRYQSTVEELKSMELTSEQKSKIESKYKLYRSKNMTQLEALSEAMEFAGVDPVEAALDARRHAARMRVPGTYTKGKADLAAVEASKGFGEVVKGDPDQAWEYLRKQL